MAIKGCKETLKPFWDLACVAVRNYLCHHEPLDDQDSRFFYLDQLWITEWPIAGMLAKREHGTPKSANYFVGADQRSIRGGCDVDATLPKPRCNRVIHTLVKVIPNLHRLACLGPDALSEAMPQTLRRQQ